MEHQLLQQSLLHKLQHCGVIVELKLLQQSLLHKLQHCRVSVELQLLQQILFRRQGEEALALFLTTAYPFPPPLSQFHLWMAPKSPKPIMPNLRQQ